MDNPRLQRLRDLGYRPSHGTTLDVTSPARHLVGWCCVCGESVTAIEVWSEGFDVHMPWHEGPIETMLVVSPCGHSSLDEPSDGVVAKVKFALPGPLELVP